MVSVSSLKYTVWVWALMASLGSFPQDGSGDGTADLGFKKTAEVRPGDGVFEGHPGELLNGRNLRVLVPGAGFEPARGIAPEDFKSPASTSSATRAR